jgi:hypothetical protein
LNISKSWGFSRANPARKKFHDCFDCGDAGDRR